MLYEARKIIDHVVSQCIVSEITKHGKGFCFIYVLCCLHCTFGHFIKMLSFNYCSRSLLFGKLFNSDNQRYSIENALVTFLGSHQGSPSQYWALYCYHAGRILVFPVWGWFGIPRLCMLHVQSLGFVLVWYGMLDIVWYALVQRTLVILLFYIKYRQLLVGSYLFKY